MRIALFSDIHANLPALESFFKSVEAQKPDAIYCLGDLVAYNVWPNEVINEIRKRGIPTIAGNYDQGMGLMSDDCGCAYKTEPEKDMGKASISFTNSITTSALLVWVSFTNLPFTKVAKVGKLLTLASFLDSGEFSASTRTKAKASFSDANFLNLGFMIRQFPHQEAENCTTTLSFFSIKFAKVSSFNSINMIFVFLVYF